MVYINTLLHTSDVKVCFLSTGDLSKSFWYQKDAFSATPVPVDLYKRQNIGL